MTHNKWPHYRVSWVVATGEFYALRLGALGGGARPGPVEVLGVAHGRDAAETALAGWAEGETSTLDWVRGRLAAYRDARRDPVFLTQTAMEIKIEADEDGMHLLLEDEDGERYDFNIQLVAYAFAASPGLRDLLDWYREGESVRREHGASAGRLDADEGYALEDPKHPTYHDRMSGLADDR